jgi:hypothetical protein
VPEEMLNACTRFLADHAQGKHHHREVQSVLAYRHYQQHYSLNDFMIGRIYSVMRCLPFHEWSRHLRWMALVYASPGCCASVPGRRLILIA